MNEGHFPTDSHQQQVFPAGKDAFEEQLVAANLLTSAIKRFGKHLDELYKQQKPNNSQVNIKFTQDNPQIIVKRDNKIIYEGNVKDSPKINLLSSADLQQLGQALNYAAGQTVPNSDRNISIKIDGEEVFALKDGVVELNRFKEHSITIDVEAISSNNNNSKESNQETLNNPSQPFQQTTPDSLSFTERMRLSTPLVMASGFERLLGQSEEYRTERFTLFKEEDAITLNSNDGRGQLLSWQPSSTNTMMMKVSNSFNPQDWQNIIEMLYQQQTQKSGIEPIESEKLSSVHSDYSEYDDEPEYEPDSER